MDFNHMLDIHRSDNNKKLRDNYIARVFGIFNESIIRIWCNSEHSPYENLGRPTIYSKSNNRERSTFDFTLKQRENKTIYIAEMKCWLSYCNYKYLELNSSCDLFKFSKESNSFKRFLDFSKDQTDYVVKVKHGIKSLEKKEVNGTILIWPKVNKEQKDNLIKKYNLSDIISLENVINDLLEHNNQDYIDLLNEKQNWFEYLITELKRR